MTRTIASMFAVALLSVGCAAEEDGDHINTDLDPVIVEDDSDTPALSASEFDGATEREGYDLGDVLGEFGRYADRSGDPARPESRCLRFGVGCAEDLPAARR